ncbi:MAG: DUF805 domain-containing protein [Sphingomonas sp.]
MSEIRRSDLLPLMARPFRDCLAFAGRSTRSELFAFLAVTMLVDMVGRQFLHIPHTPFAPPSAVEIGWTLLWSFPLLALMVRRLHDQGRSAWWMLVIATAGVIAIVALSLPQQPGSSTLRFLAWTASPAPGPLASVLSITFLATVVAMLILSLLPGDLGDNRYGADPRRAIDTSIAL